jgi:hypothetical protein
MPENFGEFCVTPLRREPGPDPLPEDRPPVRFPRIKIEVVIFRPNNGATAKDKSST